MRHARNAIRERGRACAPDIFGGMLLGVVMTLSASSAAADGEAGWTGSGRILELIPGQQGRFLFRLDTNANPSGCRNKQTYYVDYRGLGTELMFRTLLESQSRGSPVRAFVTGRCDLDGYSEADAVSAGP